MKEKIVVGVLVFLGAVSVGLAVLLSAVSPIQLKRPTFSSQLNETLITAPEHYINANDQVLANCQVVLDEVDNTILGVYPAYVLYEGQKYAFQIVIEDKKIPTVTLKDGKAVYQCFIGDEFTAADLVDVQDDTMTQVFFIDAAGEKSASVILTENGHFDYYIIAEDSSKNRSAKVRVRFEVGQDTSAPIISGIESITVKVGAVFDPLEGVSALDNADGDLTYKIELDGEVDTSTVGQYQLTYRVTDSSGNTATETRLVIVTQTGVAGRPDVGNGPFLTDEEIAARDAKVRELLENELDYFTDERFIEALNSYLIYHFKPASGVGNDTSYAVIINECGNRAAMARAVKVILDMRGIENFIVVGDEDGMVWNIVKVDGVYRHLDVYANAIGAKEDEMLLKKTAELSKAYEYDADQYPNCD